jgi:hypothetical protein
MKAFAPNGKEIRGTLETVCGVAEGQEFTRAADGSIEFVYSGSTDIWWDEQKTVTRQGQRVFIDEDGAEWPESKIVIEGEAAE